MPASLLRADGRSVYQRHGGVRFATHAQLTMEQRMLALARASGAPRMDRADAARALGADLAQLEPRAGRRRAGRARRAHADRAARGSGRRRAVGADRRPARLGDQRARRVRQDVGADRGGPGVGRGRARPGHRHHAVPVGPQHPGRRGPESYNTAQFLGHLPGQRGARGPVRLRPGDLVLMDEASMVANPDLADVISQAADSGAKVILAGDTQQLQAVENGGGLSLLADALGFVQLAEPVRFRAGWEQAASLRLRAGDTTVLAEYDQHARIRGGEPEQMMDAAAAHYLALTLDGTDVLLMAADHALRRELSRRIRDDLIRLGIVAAGPAVRIADGATASPGDLIVCTRNDHTVEAGEPGRTLANGDLLRIEAVTPDGLIVRRALDADPATGQRRWTGQQFLYADHDDAELGYAVTDHVAQSRTVHTRPGGDRRHRGPPARLRRAEPRHRHEHGVRVHGVAEARRPGAGPAPGPGAGPLRPDHRRARGSARIAAERPRPGTRSAVLAGVLDRDGQQLSASQTRQQALTDADHLAILHAIWTDQTTPAREQHYRDLLMSALPPEYRREPGHQARWLWRTLRAAELAGLDVEVSWPPRSASGTWPGPATWPPSSTPGSGTGSAPLSRSRRARGRPRSPPSPTPSAART